MKLALIALALFAAPTPTVAQAPSAPAPPPAGCSSPESRQFDFWVGRWDVFPAAHPDRKVAESLIEKLYSGCAIRENWKPPQGGGGSLNSYVPAEHAWRQTWIGSDGARVEFKGGWTGQAMVLTGLWPAVGHPEQLSRMTFTPQPDGSVRQQGEISDDGGKTWTPSFDFIYRRVTA
jgi:hypothetical protein